MTISGTSNWRRYITYSAPIRHKADYAVIFSLAFCAAALAFRADDFRVYRDAAMLVTRGYSPYMIYNFNNPIIALVYYLPFVYLPVDIGFRVTMFVAMALYLSVIWQACHSPIAFVLVLISPLMLWDTFYVNLDWMVFGAVLLLPRCPVPAFVLALVKPQIGIVVAVLALLELWKGRRYKTIAALMVFEVAIFAVSLSMGMQWGFMIARSGNWSLFPWSLLLGLPLAWYALRRRDRFAGLAAAPLCSPYVGPQSWIAVLPAAARRWWIIAAVDVAVWGMALMFIR